MKKFLLVISTLAIGFAVKAQVTLTYENHAYRVGDKHDFYLAQNKEEGSNGANVTWDFSDLVPKSNFTSLMVNPGETDKGSSVPDANLALIENDNVFYFNVDKKGIQQFASANPCNLSQFDTPYEKLRFPFNFGDMLTGTFSSNTKVGADNVTNTGSYVIEADAWGTLFLPNGVYKNTLRVKQTRILNNAGNNETKEITYRWYSSNVRYPVLVIIKYETKDTSNISKVAYAAHYPSNNSKSEKESSTVAMLSDLSLSVFPNPFFDQIQVNYNLVSNATISFELLNSAGKVVDIPQKPLKKEAGIYSEIIPISDNLAVGTYYLKVTYGKQVTVKKIVKL